MAEHLLMMINVLDDHVPTLHQKMWLLFVMWSSKIVGRPPTTSVTSWYYRKARVSECCHKNWTWLRRIGAKFVPQLLSDDEKEYCMNVCSEPTELLRTDTNYLSKVVPSDEAYFDGLTLKLNSSHLSGRVHFHLGQTKPSCQEQRQILIDLFLQFWWHYYKEFVPCG